MILTNNISDTTLVSQRRQTTCIEMLVLLLGFTTNYTALYF